MNGPASAKGWSRKGRMGGPGRLAGRFFVFIIIVLAVRCIAFADPPRAVAPGGPPGAAPVVGPGVEEALAASPIAPVVILLDVDPALARQPDRTALRREVGRAQGRLLA